MNIKEKIKSFTWEKNWSGRYTYLSSTCCCGTVDIQSKQYVGSGYPVSLLTHTKGMMTGYYDKNEKESFGKFLVNKYRADKTVLEQWTKDS